MYYFFRKNKPKKTATINEPIKVPIIVWGVKLVKLYAKTKREIKKEVTDIIEIFLLIMNISSEYLQKRDFNHRDRQGNYGIYLD